MTDEINAYNQSIAVGGDVTDSTISVGYSQADYEKGLRNREKVLRHEYAALLSLSDNRTEVQIEKRITVEKELSVIGEKLINIEASYTEVKISLNNASKVIKELEGQVPAMQLKTAQLAIQKGPEAAYEAYNAIIESASDPIAKAAFQAGLLATDLIRYKEALRHLRLAESLDKQNVAYNNALSTITFELNLFDETESLYIEGLSIAQNSFGKDHHIVATYLNNLAVLYQGQGRYSKAEPLLLEALDIRKKQHGETTEEIALALTNIATLYLAQARYDEAEPLFLESLQIRKKLLGHEHSYVANSLNNLAGLYEAQGDNAKSEKLWLEAMRIWRKQLGTDHPKIAYSMNNLASLYHSQKRYSEAEPLFHESLRIWGEQLGFEHLSVADGLNNLGGLYQSQGRYAVAESLFLNA